MGATVRNFVLAGHAGSGKTSLSDLILFKSGKVGRLGKVDDQNSVSDYRPVEHEKQNSIFSTPMNCKWNDTEFHFVDTPGNADFFGEVVAGIHAADLSIMTVDGVSGIEFGLTRAWRSARESGCPRMVYVNSLDRDNADFFAVLASLQETYGKNVCIPFTLPIGKEADFSSVFSILGGGDAPAEIADDVAKYKTALMDAAAESDEELMMAYLEGEELSQEQISAGLTSAVLDGTLVPVFCGSVDKDLGIEELMNGIVNLGPNPLAKKTAALVDGETMDIVEDGPSVSFVFKSIIDPFIGQLTILRVVSGTLKGDEDLINVTTGKKERVGGLMLLNGKEQEPVTTAGPGSIVAIAKLTDSHINNTLSSRKDAKDLKHISFPKPNCSFALYSNKPGEEDKIKAGLDKLCEEDKTIVVKRHRETGEMLISGMGNQHVEITIHRLEEANKVDVDLRLPKVPYRETIQGTAEKRYRHKKQSGGRGQFAEVSLRVSRLPEEDFEFSNEVVGGNIPRNFIPAVEKGILSTMVKGPLANCKVINVKATVFDGKYHPVDSSDMAFQIAGSHAFREAMKLATPIILEPIQHVKIMIPEEYMGDVSGDLNSRRGRILGMGAEDGLKILEAEVPLKEMFSYSSQLRSLTQGRGSFEMEFLRYEAVPAQISKEIQDLAAKEREEEH
jgi:elongation factor G